MASIYEANNTKRVYFTPANQQRFAVCREVTDAFRNLRDVHAIKRATGVNLTTGRLRIEYCQDVDGFWLEPHVDIPVKLFTMLVYLTDAPELQMPAPTSATRTQSTIWRQAYPTNGSPD